HCADVSLFLAPPPTEHYTLSLHDALPISATHDSHPLGRRPHGRAPRTETGVRARERLRGRRRGRERQAGPRSGYEPATRRRGHGDRKSTRLNSSHVKISYAVFCLKKKNHE